MDAAQHDLVQLQSLTLSAHAREGSVCVSLFYFGEGAVFGVETLSSLFFENRSYFGEKASGTSAVTAVICAGTAHSLNGLAQELLARELLVRVIHYHSLRVVASLLRLLSSK